MKAAIGMMALVGDVWHLVMAKRTGEKKTEYRLYGKDYWIHESWIKDVKGRLDS